MVRVRLAAYAALMFVLAMSATASAGPAVIPLTDIAAPLAAVAWPPSSGLLVAEVVTGGVSASDEFVELTNASAIPVDLAGVEVVYVTSSGATVTRKAAWTASLMLEPGRHLLLANSLGIFAPLADVTYSGGLAATGGAIAIRAIGGAPIDSAGWGDATNGFVEGSVAGAPAAGSSIERRPGGPDGNAVDTNDNAADFLANAAPVAQNLAAAPVPLLLPTPSPSATPAASPTPDQTATPAPAATETPAPIPTATPVPTPEPSTVPTPSPVPSEGPSPSESPSPAPSESPSPAPSPTATATPATSIAAARGLPDGAATIIEGTLTTALGALEGGRTGFVQDETAGIALYLDAMLATPIPAGTRIRASGAVSSRYAQRTLRVDGLEVAVIGASELPVPQVAVTGEATEDVEGRRLEVSGTVTEPATALADGLGLMVDDGTGAVRVIVGPDALRSLAPGTGTVVVVRGPLGQRDSGGTGLAGYRLFATLPGELEILSSPPAPGGSPSPGPSPSPTGSPAPSSSPSPSQSPSPQPTPTAAPTPTPSPTATPVAPSVDVAAARAVPVGRQTIVRGVVIAEAGRLGTPPLIVIADATGGIPVRLPDGVSGPARGTLVEVRGVIADPYGQTELRAVAGGFTLLGPTVLPVSLALDAGAVGEATEGRLATVRGTISASATKSTSNDLSLQITGDDGAVLRIMADASSGLSAASLRKGTTATFTGVIGQRASRKGALDGYRLWLRDAADIASSAPGLPSPSASAGTPPAPLLPIAAAIRREGERVAVEGVLTISATLLDTSRRRMIVEDSTGAIEVYLGAPDTGLRTGLRVRVTGTIGRAYGAPRLRVEEVVVLGATRATPRTLLRAPTVADEWCLVRVSGTVVDVHRLGTRWRAELDLGGTRIAIAGLAGSGIASTAVVEGGRATITGVVRRPASTATDQRFAIVPRDPADIVLGPVDKPAPSGASGSAPGTAGRPGLLGLPGDGRVAEPATRTQAVDLARLADHLGQAVRVGGLVTGLGPDGFDLDDGTATTHVVLTSDAAGLLDLLELGDALGVTGVPDQRGDVVLVVSDPAGLVLAGDPGSVDAGGSAASLEITDPSPLTDEHAIVRATVDRGMDLDPASAGFGTLALLAATSVVATLARRHRSRRQLQARVLGRLESIRMPVPGRERTGG